MSGYALTNGIGCMCSSSRHVPPVIQSVGRVSSTVRTNAWATASTLSKTLAVWLPALHHTTPPTTGVVYSATSPVATALVPRRPTVRPAASSPSSTTSPIDTCLEPLYELINFCFTFTCTKRHNLIGERKLNLYVLSFLLFFYVYM